MSSLFACSEICIGDVQIPAFEIFSGDYIGISFPAEYGIQWLELMELLSGHRPTNSTHVAARARLIEPPGFALLEEPAVSQTVSEFILAKGLSHSVAATIINDIHLKSYQLYRDLGLSPRLLLDLQLAWSQGAELVIFSTAGLDPSGVRGVTKAVCARPERSSAVNIFSTEVRQEDIVLAVYSKIIRGVSRTSC